MIQTPAKDFVSDSVIINEKIPFHHIFRPLVHNIPKNSYFI